MNHDLINDIAVCIIIAWILAVVAQILKQPLILAYLVAGFFIGPVGVGLVQDESSIETISGLGLVLLLFMIGLEIDLKKMLSAGRIIIVTAIAQILGSCVLGLLLFRGLGLTPKLTSLDGIYLAVAVSLSSTVIIVKILYEKRELETLPGRIALGILVLQDLFAILFLALQPDLQNPSFSLLGRSLIKVVVVIAVAFTTSRFALPPLFRAVARLPELVLVGALAWCFLISGFAGIMGLSREMGALIAGVAISTFPYTLDVGAKVTSLRDFFVTLFFVALGMTIPAPNFYLLGWAFVVALIVILSRFATVFPSLYRMKLGFRASLLPAISLSQISELSLVILALGLSSKHIGKESLGIMAYAFVFLAVISSYAITQSEGLLRWFTPRLLKMGLHDLDRDNAPQTSHRTPRIFMLGFSWTASSLLQEITIKDPDILNELAIIDFNPQVNKELRTRGINTIYGDIGQRDTLIHAGVNKAEIIVCTLPNTVLKGITNLKLLQQLREINDEAQIIVHAELFADVPKLYAAGANYVSLPRLIEAVDLCEAVQAARENLLEQKNNELTRELENRDEVIP